ncbi:N-acetylmuramic acid 6-phosphate etherase [Clostridium sp. D2Q-11]|uniref:N-acetylmuramic acid 6-phosphate etherase n=1 Tax=Anaeromonas frigoriresistens TaxID=2683708 RepID=A0A942UU91_9FIRM|nr:N-acetylmuramic acid 6-phosphate etherase [Anaeromonas frigoriresistens]MBS4536884.1 N-acetylmuramic acid 6-phosphate etherase [Anaeromonas frigoriresistens]
MLSELDRLGTEGVNERTKLIDRMSTIEFLEIMNEEDKQVIEAVNKVIPSIAKLVDYIIDSFKKNGRLIYIGAGTSGRLGILDAVECPPTFGTDPSKVVGLIAGGENAFVQAVEGAEDNYSLGKEDLKSIRLTENDIVIGLSASGRTPYVMGALEYATEIGTVTGSICCNEDSKISKLATVPIELLTGPEVLTGSTRLKAGSAQKMTLNMLSTGAMKGIGKIYKNLMVDLKPTNLKLIERAKGIIMKATDVAYEEAEEFLEASNNNPKIAIVMIKNKCSYEEAQRDLENNSGILYKAIEN